MNRSHTYRHKYSQTVWRDLSLVLSYTVAYPHPTSQYTVYYHSTLIYEGLREFLEIPCPPAPDLCGIVFSFR